MTNNTEQAITKLVRTISRDDNAYYHPESYVNEFMQKYMVKTCSEHAQLSMSDTDLTKIKNILKHLNLGNYVGQGGVDAAYTDILEVLLTLQSQRKDKDE